MFDLDVAGFDLLTDGAHILDGGFFALPLRAQAIRLFLFAGDLAFDLVQALFAGIVGFALQSLALDLELQHFAIDYIERSWLAIDLHLDPAGGLIDQVDGFVGQLAIINIAGRQRGGSNHSGILDAHPMMDFIALFQPAQNANRVLDARLLDDDRLEAPL